jgi:hypothetical protein
MKLQPRISKAGMAASELRSFGDPAIHASFRAYSGVDARVKPGHDEKEAA